MIGEGAFEGEGVPISPDISVSLQFAAATLLAPIVSLILATLSQRSRFSKMGYWSQQVIVGILFGLVAIMGTEFGIDAQGATMNVRDAAPITAGIFFGGPAGIIAGLIGGIERWFSVLWGRGMYTRLACSVATMAAGFYAALLRRYLFADRKPSWLLSLAIGAVAEVLHLLLILVTNMNDASHAFYVVQVCATPMITCNALSVAMSGAAIAIASGQSLRHHVDLPDISQRVQSGLLGVVAVIFLVTVCFVYSLQQSLVVASSNAELSLGLTDVEADIRDASDSYMLFITRQVAREVPLVSAATNENLETLAQRLDVNEIHAIDEHGIIVASNDPSYLGFDMASGEQSSEFLELLDDEVAEYLVQSYQPQTIDSNVWRKFSGIRVDDGILQVSYDGDHFISDLVMRVISAVSHRHVGVEGTYVVLDESGSFVGSHVGIEPSQSALDAFVDALAANSQGDLFEFSFDGNAYYAMWRSVEGFRVVGCLPASEADFVIALTVFLIAFLDVIMLAALFTAIYLLIKSMVVKSIWQVNSTLGKITSGDLEAQVDVRSSAEFALLSDDINETVGALRDAIAAEGARIERDLATAKAIQESALPRTFPPFPDIDTFDIYATMHAAREVGGDFYDFFLIDDHTLGFLIADVSGKGIPASLFMMAAKTELANYIGSGMELSEAVKTANWRLCHGNDADMFVTVWAATLDYSSGKLTYVNAGHNYPLLRHNGVWSWLSNRCGPLLGSFESASYRQEVIYLEKGDELLLYTDGVNEAFSCDEEEFGNARLEAFLTKRIDLHPHALIDQLWIELKNWATGAEQSDDITMLSLEYGIPPESTASLTVAATKDQLDQLLSFVHDALAERLCPLDAQGKIDVVLTELFTSTCTRMGENAHGQVTVEYVFNTNPNALTLSLTDEAAAFDPLGPDADESIRRAITLVDDFSYIRDGERNVVAFRKMW